MSTRLLVLCHSLVGRRFSLLVFEIDTSSSRRQQTLLWSLRISMVLQLVSHLFFLPCVGSERGAWYGMWPLSYTSFLLGGFVGLSSTSKIGFLFAGMAHHG